MFYLVQLRGAIHAVGSKFEHEVNEREMRCEQSYVVDVKREEERGRGSEEDGGGTVAWRVRGKGGEGEAEGYSVTSSRT